MKKIKDVLQDPTNVGDINSSGRITQQGTFAEIYAHDNATLQAIPAGTTYTKIAAFTNDGHSSNCQPDGANSQIIATKAGYYSFDSCNSVKSGTNNVVVLVAAFSDNIEQNNIHYERKISTSGDVGSAPASGFIKVLNDGDLVDLRVRHDNVASVNLTFTYGNFNITYLGKL